MVQQQTILILLIQVVFFSQIKCEDVCSGSPCKSPRIKSHPQNITSSLGGSVKFSCTARANPKPTVKWLKNDIPVKKTTSDNIEIKFSQRIRNNNKRSVIVTSDLTIHNVYNKDFATYKCTAKNNRGEVNSQDAYLTLDATGTSIDNNPNHVRGSKKFEESRKQQCLLYQETNATVCSGILDPARHFYTVHGSNFKLGVLSQLKSLMTEHVSEKCMRYAMSFLCHYNMPYCSTLQPPTPTQVCQNDCIVLSENYCKEEFQNAMSNPALKSLIPRDCSVLPTKGCVSIVQNPITMSKTISDKFPTEVDANDNCYFGKGEKYKGVVEHSHTNLKCRPWDETAMSKKYPQLLSGHSYCRNPGLQEERPWCYVVDNKQNLMVKLCDIPQCAGPVHPHVTSIWYTIIPCLVFSIVVSLVIITLAWRKHKQHFYDSPTNTYHKQLAPRVNPKIMEIAREDLCEYRLLGEGTIGRVYSAEFTCTRNARTQTTCVAVKALIEKPAPKQIEDFVREAETRANFKHENVIALIGVVTKEEPLSLAYEFTEFGDLHEYLLRHSRNFSNAHATDDCEPLEFNDLLAISTQIASGMTYLSTHAFVHKDLAARNCLVAENGIVKICDFSGLSDMYASDYLRCPTQALPVRWMSPESLAQMNTDQVVFSSASDVWSYGVLLWEVFSYGSRPYFGVSNTQCIQLITDRKLLQCPDGCPPPVYAVMMECWSPEDSRVTFVELYNKLKAQADLVTAATHNMKPRLSNHSIHSRETNALQDNSIQRSVHSLHSARSDFSSHHSIARASSNGYHSLPRDHYVIYPPTKVPPSPHHPDPHHFPPSPHQSDPYQPGGEYIPMLQRTTSKPPPSFASSFFHPSCPPTSTVRSPSSSGGSEPHGPPLRQESIHSGQHIFI